jgi:Spy/CpxP family protein refolding chaperone
MRRIVVLIAAATFSAAFSVVPLSVSAQQQQSVIVAQAASPSPQEVKAAVKQALTSADLTRSQKRQVKGMVENYEAQTTNADAATKKTASKTLIKNIYGILTPSQQATFKASLKQSLSADMQ